MILPALLLIAGDLPLFGDLTLGPHPVGFASQHLVDPSRPHPLTGKPGRPIQMALWIPLVEPRAEPQAEEEAEALSLADYVNLTAQELKEEELDARAIARARAAFYGARFVQNYPKEGLDELLKASMFSTSVDVGKVEAPEDPFPLVLFGQGFSMPVWVNAPLCEYLASHGYVVASCPSVGPKGRDMSFDTSGAETQAQDLLFLRKNLSGRDFVDEKRAATIGFSFGGLAALLAACDEEGIGALVSLDGAVGQKHGVRLLRETRPELANEFDTPFLYLTLRGNKIQEAGFDRSLVLSLEKSDVRIVKHGGMGHRDFSSLGLMAALVHGPDDPQVPQIQRARKGHEWAMRYVLAFLDAELAGDPKAKEFLANAPEKNGVPEGWIQVQHQAPKEAAATK